jgi:hypothetical protein
MAEVGGDKDGSFPLDRFRARPMKTSPGVGMSAHLARQESIRIRPRSNQRRNYLCELSHTLRTGGQPHLQFAPAVSARPSY